MASHKVAKPSPHVADRLARVRDLIAGAAARSQRSADVTLIAVTKGVELQRIEEALSAGVTDVGESRVQEAAPKIAALGAGARWHLVGHLQRNKARKAGDLFQVIHSVDRAELLDSLVGTSSRRAVPGPAGRLVEVLLQVNVAGEHQKHGVASEGLADLARVAAGAHGLRVIGLMTIAPLGADPETTRGVFRRLRMLRDELNAGAMQSAPLQHLSMGMSDDFQIAVEEGATMVRIGRGIFGPRD